MSHLPAYTLPYPRRHHYSKNSVSHLETRLLCWATFSITRTRWPSVSFSVAGRSHGFPFLFCLTTFWGLKVEAIVMETKWSESSRKSLTGVRNLYSISYTSFLLIHQLPAVQTQQHLENIWSRGGQLPGRASDFQIYSSRR